MTTLLCSANAPPNPAMLCGAIAVLSAAVCAVALLGFAMSCPCHVMFCCDLPCLRGAQISYAVALLH